MLLAAGILLAATVLCFGLAWVAAERKWGFDGEDPMIGFAVFGILFLCASIGIAIPGFIYANYHANIVGDLEAQNFKVEKASGFDDWAIIRIDGKRAKCSVDTESGYQYVIRKGTCNILPNPKDDDADINDVKKQLAGLEGK